MGRQAFGRLRSPASPSSSAISRARAATSSTRTASSTPATSPPSTPTATCRSPTAPRTSSSRAASGFPRSTSKTSRSAIPMSLEAAVIGVAHPKWDERPLLVVVPKEGQKPQAEEVLDFLKPDRQMVAARRHAGGEGDPPHRDRQDQQAEAARDVQGTTSCRPPEPRLLGERPGFQSNRPLPAWEKSAPRGAPAPIVIRFVKSE